MSTTKPKGPLGVFEKKVLECLAKNNGRTFLRDCSRMKRAARKLEARGLLTIVTHRCQEGDWVGRGNRKYWQTWTAYDYEIQSAQKEIA